MKKIELLRNKLAILSLVGTIALTGCSNTKEDTKANGNEVLVEYTSHYNPELYDNKIDDIMGLKNTYNEDLYKEKINYNYFIDNTNLTKEELSQKYKDAGEGGQLIFASFARLVDENTITDKISFNDDKSAMSLGTFKSSLQVITCPDSIKNNKIPIECANYEINVKKLVSIHGQTFYYIDSKLIFNDNVKYYSTSAPIHSGDVIECECLYQLFSDGKFIELSRNQTGLGSESDNIINSNFNNESKVVSKVDETVFKDMNGEYKESYLREALDTYTGSNLFESKDNEGIDFSQYKKVLTKED